jgi:hypothetical protein
MIATLAHAGSGGHVIGTGPAPPAGGERLGLGAEPGGMLGAGADLARHAEIPDGLRKAVSVVNAVQGGGLLEGVGGERGPATGRGLEETLILPRHVVEADRNAQLGLVLGAQLGVRVPLRDLAAAGQLDLGGTLTCPSARWASVPADLEGKEVDPNLSVERSENGDRSGRGEAWGAGWHCNCPFGHRCYGSADGVEES